MIHRTQCKGWILWGRNCMYSSENTLSRTSHPLSLSHICTLMLSSHFFFPPILLSLVVFLLQGSVGGQTATAENAIPNKGGKDFLCSLAVHLTYWPLQSVVVFMRRNNFFLGEGGVYAFQDPFFYSFIPYFIFQQQWLDVE